jgi:plastocyanin
MTVLEYDGARPVTGGEHGGAHGPSGATPASRSNPAPPASPPAATATVAATASPAQGTTHDGAAEEVVALDNRFLPATVTVPAGTTVQWVNRGNNAHTISSADGLWDSGTLLHGESTGVVLSTPGTYRYLCRQHVLQGMGGTIIVTPP